MAKVTLKGKIYAVYSSEKIGTGEKETVKQTFIFLVPAWKDGFGDTKGKDEFWEIDIIGDDNIKKYGITADMENRNAVIDLYLNSNTIPAKAATKDDPARPEKRIINANLAAFALHSSPAPRS